MSPEEVDLDSLQGQDGLSSWVRALEERQLPAVTLRASVRDWDRIQSAILMCRAANISVVLLLKAEAEAEGTVVPMEELPELLGLLRLWGQCLLHNILVLLRPAIPAGAIRALGAEAKIELMWFREWGTASSDARVHRYPGLPWRSFMRNVNEENFAFAVRLLELEAREGEPAPEAETAQAITEFLAAKKKVVNIFPKRRHREDA